jgi:rod shape-determining protein MreC
MNRWRIVVYTLLISMSLLLLAMNDTPEVQDVRRGVNFALAPVLERLSDAARSAGSVFGAVAEIDQLRRDNRRLQAEADELKQRVDQLEVVRAENERLSRLLGRKSQVRHETISAPVISRPANQFERLLTISRGTEAGIARNDPVLSDGGALVGVVADVGEGTATVRLLNDSRSVVIGMDSRTEALGEVYGRLTGTLEMRNIQKADRIAPGDLVMTAGLDLGEIESRYPRGLLIGTVLEVDDDPAKVVKSALLQPATDLDRLQQVLVVIDERRPRGRATPEPLIGASPEPTATAAPEQGERQGPRRTQRPRRTPRP